MSSSMKNIVLFPFYFVIIVDSQEVAKVVFVPLRNGYNCTQWLQSDRIKVQYGNWEFEVGTMYVVVLLFHHFITRVNT